MFVCYRRAILDYLLSCQRFRSAEPVYFMRIHAYIPCHSWLPSEADQRHLTERHFVFFFFQVVSHSEGGKCTSSGATCTSVVYSNRATFHVSINFPYVSEDSLTRSWSSIPDFFFVFSLQRLCETTSPAKSLATPLFRNKCQNEKKTNPHYTRPLPQTNKSTGQGRSKLGWTSLGTKRAHFQGPYQSKLWIVLFSPIPCSSLFLFFSLFFSSEVYPRSKHLDSVFFFSLSVGVDKMQSWHMQWKTGGDGARSLLGKKERIGIWDFFFLFF